MIVLYYGSIFPFKNLASCVCNYRFVDRNCTYPMKFEKLDHLKEIIGNLDPDTDIYNMLATNIRVSEMDADTRIQNRFAYTSVFIGWEEAKTLTDVTEMFNHNDKIIKWLYKKAGEDEITTEAEKILTYLQQQIWLSIEPELKTKLVSTASSFLEKWSIQASIQYLSPDYIWKSGNNSGKTTMEILTERWKIRVSTESLMV